MNFIEEGNQILEEHRKMFEFLLQIPEKRKKYYSEIDEEGYLIGKPRFNPNKYTWTKEELLDIHNHFQRIWNFFQNYSFWFDESIKELIQWDSRIVSKKSIIYLLENDVWCTDEVYGAYLIEETSLNTVISYWRFKERKEQFKLNKLNKKEREKWIWQDAVRQIQQQFKKLWERIEIEIIVCLEEDHHRFPPIKLPDGYIEDQSKLCLELIKISPEATLLSLGRLAELFILKLLKKDQSERDFHPINFAREMKIITRDHEKFLKSIRIHYNALKHQVNYDIRNCELLEMVNRFILLVKDSSIMNP